MDLERCAVVAAAIEKESSALRELSSEIWRTPELAYEETHAHELLTQFLAARGFAVEREFTLPTAFRATWGGEKKKEKEGGVNVAVLCEYDALPGIGHACGHNLIAEAGVAAGLGVQAAMKSCPQLQNNCLTVLGCPAEEGEGGKIKMIENGCFEGVDCALMVHPFSENAVVINALARSYYRVTFSSPPPPLQPPTSPHSPDDLNSEFNTNTLANETSDLSTLTSHTMPPPTCKITKLTQTTNVSPVTSSGGPRKEDDIQTSSHTVEPNPLDAAVLAYTSLSLLRQQLKPSWMIHGVISHGGRSLALSPTYTELLYYFRAPTFAELSNLEEKARACFESAALATGCQVTITEKSATYKDVVSNPTLVNLFLKNSQKLGIEFSESTMKFSASTDMGNVSHVVPSIHPVFSVTATPGHTPAALHTRHFTGLANTASAHRATLQAAEIVAMTTVDVMSRPHLLNEIQLNFNRAASPGL